MKSLNFNPKKAWDPHLLINDVMSRNGLGESFKPRGRPGLRVLYPCGIRTRGLLLAKEALYH
jgi:hypothetical protein